jgi:hypothetical protein
MATLAIDDRLLEEAQRLGEQRTKQATVTEALQEYIQRRRQASVDFKAGRDRVAKCVPCESLRVLLPPSD